MSTTGKRDQTAAKPVWKRNAEGASVVHTTTLHGFKLAVTSWPGFRTLRWDVSLPGTSLLMAGAAGEEFKPEHGVNSLKKKCIATAKRLKAEFDASSGPAPKDEIDPLTAMTEDCPLSSVRGFKHKFRTVATGQWVGCTRLETVECKRCKGRSILRTRH